MALCYGKNNGGACAAGSVHPLAPNVVQSSPRPFSYPTRLPINPPSPLFLFTPSPSLSPPLKLHFLPTFLSFSSPFHLSHFLCLYPCLLFISPPVSPLNFILSFAPQRQPFTHGTQRRTKHPPKMQILHRNAIAVEISALKFSPALLARVTLCSRSLKGHCFPSPLCGRGLDGGVEGSCWPRALQERLENGVGVLEKV